MKITKHEWRKHEKEYYLPKQEPVLVTVPEFKYIMLEGYGNPNNEEFSDAIGVLYSVAYGIKMLPKNGVVREGYFEYTVYPLEGIWEGVEDEENLDKDKLHYKIMMRQPDFVDEDLFKIVIEMVKKKKPHVRLDEVEFATMDEGLAIQALHMGSYDNESETFDKMKKYCEENSLKRVGFWHREIYLSDARKTEKNKLKTVLQYNVEKIH